MTLKKAQRITGCDIQVISSDGDTHLAIAIDNGKQIAATNGSKLKKVLEKLVANVYSLRSEQARVASGFRCTYCGKICPLQTHHKVHRARGGRSDAVDGLLPSCPACHAKRHGG